MELETVDNLRYKKIQLAEQVGNHPTPDADHQRTPPLNYTMLSATTHASEGLPDPPVFKPKDNPAFILHGKLETSYQEVSWGLARRVSGSHPDPRSCLSPRSGQMRCSSRSKRR